MFWFWGCDDAWMGLDAAFHTFFAKSSWFICCASSGLSQSWLHFRWLWKVVLVFTFLFNGTKLSAVSLEQCYVIFKFLWLQMHLEVNLGYYFASLSSSSPFLSCPYCNSVFCSYLHTSCPQGSGTTSQIITSLFPCTRKQGCCPYLRKGGPDYAFG